MVRREVALILLAKGYKPELPNSPDTWWHHPKKRFDVRIRYGGSILVCYLEHPKYYSYDSQTQEYFLRKRKG